jgi:cytochrome c biogenesis protein CcmG, thiol:disulfide interchange protein DsbE
MGCAPGHRRLAALVLLGGIVCSSAASEGGPALLALRVQHAGGEARTLGTVLGQEPAVVNFWATYCLPCRAEVPVLNRAARRLRAHGVRVVGVAIDIREASAATRTADAWGIAYESFWTGDEQAESARRLLPEGLPATFFTTPQGTHRVDRFLTDETLDRLAEEHLGVRVPSP